MCRRVFTRLLVLFLAPVVVLAASDAATAAVVETPAVGVTWNIEGSSMGGYGGLECSAVVTGAYIDGISAQFFFDSVDCIGETDLSPGTSQPGEPGSTVDLWLVGTDCGGKASGTFGAGSEDGLMHVHGYIESLSYAAGPSTCDPAQACIRVTGNGSIRQLCNAVEIDPPTPQPANGECRWGKVLVPSVSAILPSHFHSQSTYYDKDVLLTVEGKRPPEVPGPLSTKQWWTYVVVRKSDGTSQAVGNKAALAFAGEGLSNQTVHVVLNKTNAVAPLYDIIGVGVAFADPAEATSGYDSQSTSNYVGTGSGWIGKNKPDACMFYWGVKVGSTTADDYDEPIGALTGPGSAGGGSTGTPAPVPPVEDPVPPAQEEGCTGFSWTDPGSWASAGICALVGLMNRVVGLLGRVVSGIASLASAIVGGILGGLGALFVPENAPDWGDVPSPLPAGWTPSMPDLGGASCGDLTFPQLDVGYQDWKVGPVTFANTCASPWPTVRSVTYNGMLIMVLVSAIWMGFRAIASGLGMGVQMGSSGGDDDR